MKSLLTSILKGKKVLVLGSAPNPVIPQDVSFEWVVCVNGSSKGKPASLYDLPTLHVLNEEFRIRTPLNIERVRARDGIPIDDQDSYLFVRTNLEAMRSILTGQPNELRGKFLGTIKLSQLNRWLSNGTSRRFKLSYPDGLPSTGGIAIAITSLAKAEEVWIAGFNVVRLSDTAHGGHSYESLGYEGGASEMSPRNHATADSYLLSSLSISGKKLFTADPELRFLTELNFRGLVPDWKGKYLLLMKFLYSRWSPF
jgi:hypothetical protein